MDSQITFFNLRWKPLCALKLPGDQILKSVPSMCGPLWSPSLLERCFNSFWFFFFLFLYIGFFSLHNSNSHLTHSFPPESNRPFPQLQSSAQKNRSTVAHRNTAKIFPCEETEESANGFKVIMNLGKQNKQDLVSHQRTLKPHSLWKNCACHFL